jgi:hypothetical protein
VSDGFHARVIAARLGAEGIVTQLRGGYDSPYPMGDVEVLVAVEDLDEARAILLADEVESAFDDELLERSPRRQWRPWVALTLSAALVLADIAVLAFRP